MTSFQHIHISVTDLSFSDYYYLDFSEGDRVLEDLNELPRGSWIQVDIPFNSPRASIFEGFEKRLIFIQKKPCLQPVSGVISIENIFEIRELLIKQQEYHYDLDPDYFSDVDHFQVESYLQEIREKLRGGYASAFGIQENGRWIGFAVVEKDKDTAYLLELMVEKSARGKGYGKMLLAACENWTAERDLCCLWTSLSSQNETAFHFYEKTGFEPSKERYSHYRLL